jgi:hypothetical protein
MGFLHSRGRRAESGRALVINADALRMATGQLGIAQQSVHSKIRVRVIPDDGGSEFESNASVWGGDEEHLLRGHWTYVLYDTGQPDECDIDSDRLAKEFGRVDGKKRRTSVPKWVSDEWTERNLEIGADRPAQEVGSAPIAETSQNTEPTSSSERMVANLTDLAQLHAEGALNDAEYAEAKSRLLAHG